MVKTTIGARNLSTLVPCMLAGVERPMDGEMLLKLSCFVNTWKLYEWFDLNCLFLLFEGTPCLME